MVFPQKLSNLKKNPEFQFNSWTQDISYCTEKYALEASASHVSYLLDHNFTNPAGMSM